MIQELNFEEDLIRQFEELETLNLDSEAIILREEAYIKHIPIVLNGSIKVYKTDETGKEIILYHILPGQSCILSISSCLNDKASKASAKAEENSRIIIVPSEKVKEWIDLYPGWRKFVHRLYYQRLDEVLSLIDNIAFKQVDTRLLSKLKNLQASQGDIIRKTHQELANEIGTAREVVSRLLKHLEKEGKLILERGEIRIISEL